MTHHDHDLDPATLHTAEFWDERYGSTEALWSGRPNQRLVENVSGRPPGTALEVGCGEGADAIWLAQQGWTVTAVDVSQVGLDRAARHAAEMDPEAAERITWRRKDLREWAPEPASFDLVTEHFLHLPSALRVRQHARLAAAVRSDGMLLLVGHHAVDHARLHRPHAEDLYFHPDKRRRRCRRRSGTSRRRRRAASRAIPRATRRHSPTPSCGRSGAGSELAPRPRGRRGCPNFPRSAWTFRGCGGGGRRELR